MGLIEKSMLESMTTEQREDHELAQALRDLDNGFTN